jgi:hypothetical protein
MQHRIIVVEIRPGLPAAEAHRHWRERHAEVYALAPLLRGYVQNRPLEEEWPRLGARSICSETWFDDREAERESFTSPYYLDVVMPDEETFLERASAWAGRLVAGTPGLPGRARYRVLAFGTDSLPGADADVLQVDRPTWVGGDTAVASLWLADRERALEIARSTSVFAFAAEPAVVVAPPPA